MSFLFKHNIIVKITFFCIFFQKLSYFDIIEFSRMDLFLTGTTYQFKQYMDRMKTFSTTWNVLWTHYKWLKHKNTAQHGSTGLTELHRRYSLYNFDRKTKKSNMNLSRRSLTPVQVRPVDPHIRVVSPHATMNVQTSSPLSKLSFSIVVKLYEIKN